MMVSWVNVGKTITYDWYEIRCHFEKDNRLKVYLNGLKNKQLQFCVDFGKVLLYKAIDEGWDLNPFEYEGNSDSQPIIRDAILVELNESRLKKTIQGKYPNSVHHYQVLGINFGVDVVAKDTPTILTR